ncbi:type II secretion system secretin GspD [Paraburkholderia sp.]|uniref:type II secretion system secretin GspD n=1 Tax=Paraburkholderia sp. TaxID=1926495 RepID=UPI002382A1AA|nr:type II secretion system secretin GspD [Paraburkholderia sp.]MDE1181342.1 type II secretion system secretin GspD [Paraburkholderia sp.]
MALRRVATALLVAGLITTQIAHAQVTLNFVNADIDQVAKAIGAATGKTIIVDPRVKGQLNLVSENAVPEDQALKTLQSALRMQGFALVQDHGVLKVVPEADAKLQGVPTYIGNAPTARGDQVITQVFELKNESANNLLPVLRPLISPNNTVAAYPANNTIVVTDYADNVRRIAQIIAGVDTAAGQQVAVIPMKNANALDAATQLSKMLDPGAIGSTDATLKVSVTADPRTNSLLLRASNAGRLSAARTLARELDAPTAQPGNMHVVTLRNADAVRLAKTLRGMLGKGNGDSSSTGNSSSGNNSTNSFNQNGNSSTGTSGMPPLPSGSTSASGSNPMGGSSNGGNNSAAFLGDKDNTNSSEDSNSGGGMIQADAATNSLIITAPDPVYRNLRTVIDQLDARRAQVYIEALIVELSATTSANLGIQWQGALLSSSGNNGVYGGSNFASNGSQGIVNLTATGAAIAQNPTTALAAAGTGLLNNGLNIGLLHQFGNVFGLGGLLQALSQNTDANILSTPNLITLDNEEAKIVVGQNVPIVTGSYATPTANTTTSVSAFNTFDRQDVGITLHVKPQITEGGVLKLQLYQEDSSVDSTTTSNPGGVTINKRSIQSTILADDGEIVVLGGLMQDNYANGNSKVPLLGDIPWLGQLFRSENKSRTKTNLMVFLRPVIVRDATTSNEITMNRYDYVRGQTNNYQSDNRLIRDKNGPMVPPPPPGPSQGVPAAQNLFDLNRIMGQIQGGQPAGPGTPGTPTVPSNAVNNAQGATTYTAPGVQTTPVPQPQYQTQPSGAAPGVQP